MIYLQTILLVGEQSFSCMSMIQTVDGKNCSLNLILVKQSLSVIQVEA